MKSFFVMLNILLRPVICGLMILFLSLSIVQAEVSSQDRLDVFVSWLARKEISSLSPKELMQQLTQMNIAVKQGYHDKDNLLLRACPDFMDAILKFRFQSTGKKAPKQFWTLLDGQFYIPDLSRVEIQNLKNKLNLLLGKATKETDIGSIQKIYWMLDKFVGLGMRVDVGAGNVSLSYEMLQGDQPF